jgi:PadR family transcriptional regulator PadR
MEPEHTEIDEAHRSLERKFQKELNAGLVGLLLLAVLARSGSPVYGYQLAKDLEREAPLAKLGTLYPVLRALEAQGLLSSRVEPSIAGPPRKYYAITLAGREILSTWIHQWEQTRSSVDRVLGGNHV